MKRNILIGGAWTYSNYYLHIGHLSTLLPGDIVARYHRLNGDNVIYVSGSDCHGTPITQRAKKEGKTAAEIANFYHEEFVKSFERAEFSYDMYTKTMDDEHKKRVQEIFLKIYENEYFYDKEEDQDYCENCQAFLSDREIKGTCPHCGGEAMGDQCDVCLLTLSADEVLDKHCKECGTKTVNRKNKHLYYKLSAFQDILEKYINEHEHIWRKNAVGETKKFLEMGLIDRAATRQLDWGVELPIKGFEDKRIYVWFEAVLGYLTTTMRVCEERGIDFEAFMKNENFKSYYSHGKDNIPFHTVIYPSLLASMNKGYKFPDVILSGEYVNLNDEKMSKSKGNLLTANELIEEFGVDTARYYIIANGPEKKDVNFTKNDLIQAHNKFLVGVIGNFINRNLSFVNKKFDGLITAGTIDPEIKKITLEKYQSISDLFEKGELKSAIESVVEYASIGNKYYDDQTPWVKVKEDINAFNDVTYTCVYMMANLANFLAPFIPNASAKIKNMLSLNEPSWEEVILNGDIQINELELLFNRLEEEK